jgi:hypothetical protein
MMANFAEWPQMKEIMESYGVRWREETEPRPDQPFCVGMLKGLPIGVYRISEDVVEFQGLAGNTEDLQFVLKQFLSEPGEEDEARPD